MNPQRLEGPGRRVDAAGPAADHAGHQLGQLARAGDRAALPPLDDRPRDAPGCRLLAIAPQDVGERIRIGAVHDVRRTHPYARHAHVERAVRGEREAAAGLVELHGGHPQIEHHAVEPPHAVRREQLGHVAKTALEHREPGARGRQLARRGPSPPDRGRWRTRAPRRPAGSLGCSRRPRTWHRGRRHPERTSAQPASRSAARRASAGSGGALCWSSEVNRRQSCHPTTSSDPWPSNKPLRFDVLATRTAHPYS